MGPQAGDRVFAKCIVEVGTVIDFYTERQIRERTQAGLAVGRMTRRMPIDDEGDIFVCVRFDSGYRATLVWRQLTPPVSLQIIQAFRREEAADGSASG